MYEVRLVGKFGRLKRSGNLGGWEVLEGLGGGMIGRIHLPVKNVFLQVMLTSACIFIADVLLSYIYE
jgi:hypothetical protein